ncbi:MAG: GGDEF domain-containing protein [Succiniclasticum sp.]
MDYVVNVDYQSFMTNNRIKVNRYLNTVLWFFIIAGPAIALGVKANIFPDITYQTCFMISLLVVIMSAVHLMLVKRLTNSVFTSAFALTALDILIVYMAFSHVSIHLTWFLVPLLSVLFCDRLLYFYALGLNYVLMVATTWMTAPYYVSQGSRYENTTSYFLDVVGGLTIETVVMAVSGYLIVNLTVNYFKENFRQYEMIREQKKNVQEKMEILDSMVEVYDNVNLISFVDNTEMSLRDSEQKKHVIDMASQTHTLMNQRLKNSVMPDHLDAFLTFTNITTVRNRLRNKRIISSDFIDVVAGWFRAQYITVDAASDGLPNVVIYTTRNVEEDKRREQHLLRLSMTDEMTRLYNRRCYDEDMAEYKNKTPEEDFVLFSVDVNGLKTVNDTKGHAAGDELIKGAADCLVLSVGPAGKAYRTGGDEFMAIVHTKTPEKIREAIWRKVSEWRGMYTEKMTLSVGYAAYSGHQGATADDLEHIADADMYAEKERYYKENGIDRRRKRS